MRDKKQNKFYGRGEEPRYRIHERYQEKTA
jgi:hypothetical protein